MFPKLSCSQCDHTTYSRWWNVNGVMGTTSRQGPLKPPIYVLHAPSIYALQGSMMILEATWYRFLSIGEKEPGSLNHHLEESHPLIQNSSFIFQFSSVQFSHSVVSDSLWPHEQQHARPPCPSPTARIYPNPCPLSWWCHPIILSSVVPFSSCPQSFPAIRVFQWVSSLH